MDSIRWPLAKYGTKPHNVIFRCVKILCVLCRLSCQYVVLYSNMCPFFLELNGGKRKPTLHVTRLLVISLYNHLVGGGRLEKTA